MNPVAKAIITLWVLIKLDLISLYVGREQLTCFVIEIDKRNSLHNLPEITSDCRDSEVNTL